MLLFCSPPSQAAEAAQEAHKNHKKPYKRFFLWCIRAGIRPGFAKKTFQRFLGATASEDIWVQDPRPSLLVHALKHQRSAGFPADFHPKNCTGCETCAEIMHIYAKKARQFFRDPETIKSMGNLTHMMSEKTHRATFSKDQRTLVVELDFSVVQRWDMRIITYY